MSLLFDERNKEKLGHCGLYLHTNQFQVIILDFQHFYEFNAPDHDKLMSIISNVFSGKLLPYNNYMEHITLHYLTMQYKYQVCELKII